MPTKTPQELHSLVTNILLAVGATEANASRVAEALVSSHLAGVDPHGVWHLAGYVRDIRDGYLVPTAVPEIVSETTATALVTGNWTFGFVAAKYAMELAIQKAGEQGVSVVGIVRCGHIGRLGEYSEMAAAEGMVSMVWAGGYSEDQQTTMPFGGLKPILHTNPLSMGFPAGDEVPMILDFATTGVSGSKVVQARDRGEKLPPGCIVDKDGNPTTNPEEFFNGGGHLPFGGHKGYAIMLAVETLGRILTGSDSYAESHRGGLYNRHQGITIVVVKADVFQPLGDFTTRVDDLERRIRDVPPAPGFKEVLVPGDLESRSREARRDGIPVPDDVWKVLTDLATEVGVAAE
jgi:LDH2 family malate/lactate/ureidoglycolate dehydrogenase